MEIVKKRKKTRKFKQNIERFLMWVFMLIGMLVVLGWSMNVFREAGNYLLEPKKLTIESVDVVGTPVAHAEPVEAHSVKPEREQEETQAPLPLEIDEVIDRIGWIESNNGQVGHAKTCKEKGLSNNYGYNLPTCFKTDQEAREAVEWQLKKYASEGLDLQTSLCRYNTGEIKSECDYLNKFYAK